MRYMGGKSRIAKTLAQVMLELSDNRTVYVEPFLGGGAVAEQMVQHFEHAYLSDAHEDLMLMWAAILGGWHPPKEVSYERYQELRYSSEPSALRGFVGYACSFGGKWFAGYSAGTRGDGPQTGYNVLTRQAALMAGAVTRPSGYDALPAVPDVPLIYCDPPYEGTTGYDRTTQFSHAEFWAKAQGWAETGADVFVSEYSAPEDWVSVWEKEVTGQLDHRKDRTKPIEKLFVWGQSELAERAFSVDEELAA